MPRQLSKTMEKYLDDLHYAEFGYYYDGGDTPLYPKSNPRKVVSLLEKALLWKKYANLEALAIYLGYECDNRIETRDGCKSIIRENIKAWRNIMMRYEEEIFGNMEGYILATDTDPENVKPGDEVYLVNTNCEFEYDNIKGAFQKNLMYYIICDLEFIESDLSEYKPSKSNNAGRYAFATCKIKKIKDITY